MPLPRKLTIIVVLVFLVSGLLSFAIQQIFIMPSFIALEKETAVKNAERVIGAINRELDQITPLVSDWSIWTDTYDFARGRNPEYVSANLDEVDTLKGMGINFLGIYDTNGKSIWTQAVDLENEELIDLEVLTGQGLPSNHPLLQKTVEGGIEGLVPTETAPLLIVSKPILTNNSKGPVAGTLIMGRFLGNDAIENIASLTRLSITVHTADKNLTPVKWKSNSKPSQVLHYSQFEQIETPENWEIETTLSDIYGEPIMTLQVKTSRNISAQGAMAVTQSLWVLAITGLIVMLVFWKLLQHTILRPISVLTEHAMLIGKEDTLQIHLGLTRQDELGILARTFDQMVDRLAETRRRLVDQSFHSGVAEMASGVLHNIGNAITPLNTRLSLLQNSLGNTSVADIELAVTELADPATPADRRTDLAKFLELSSQELTGIVNESQKTVEKALQQVGQIEGILMDQQRFSRSARVIEPVAMVHLIEEVRNGLDPELTKLMSIEVTPSVVEAGAVSGTRVALQQVLTNIFINAAESIQSSDMQAGSLKITANNENNNGQALLHLRFEDNGEGIPPDILERVFERGFTTKNRQVNGYGLHWSANTVHNQGGTIHAENNDDGRGACLHVILPIAENRIQGPVEGEGS